MIDPLWSSIADAAEAAGIDALGVTPVGSWTSTRSTLEARRAAGLSSTVQFTYRRPARSTEPARILADARTVVVAARGYAAPAPIRRSSDDPPSATVARYAAIDHYAALRQSLQAVRQVLVSEGHRGVIVADDNALVDREAAWRAGLGWYGKNSMILLPGHGSWFVLGAVVTDADIRVDPHPVPDGCGACQRCLPACPTGAIVAPGVVDAGRCLSWILQTSGRFPEEFREAVGDRVYGCDDCQEACPPSRVDERRRVRSDGPSPAAGSTIDIVEALRLTDSELMDSVPHWYVPDRDGAVIRRNLLIAAGNTSSRDLGELSKAIEDQLAHHDDAVVDAARWAKSRLRHGASVASVAGGRDDDPS